ncbi:hypothetical protein LWM68_41220 [Niabella sp. W65]|nr:hypothetical protein [Niabella sp. W65]MCH7368594.1 hypothetical protein [Niabella sp. W65]ULT44180.1 hypothetical protein KRR40_12915 [Niabella sp. I65]
MKTPKSLALLLLTHTLLSTISYSQSAEKKQELIANINWLAGKEDAPAKLSVWAYQVPVGNGKSTMRGPLSANSCLMYATGFALAGRITNL